MSLYEKLLEKISDVPSEGIKLPPQITPLKDSDKSNGNLRFRVDKNGKIRAYRMDPTDYNIGIDLGWFAWEEYVITPDGLVQKILRGYPREDAAYFFSQESKMKVLRPQEILNSKTSKKIIKRLTKIINSFIKKNLQSVYLIDQQSSIS